MRHIRAAYNIIPILLIALLALGGTALRANPFKVFVGR